MQRTAQDWLVLTQLTHHSGAATGATVGFQFLPLLLFSPYAGVLVDRYPRRLLLISAQIVMGFGALSLSVLVLTHTVHLWEVFCCAFIVGVGSAIDNPARQALIPELVERELVPGAVGLVGAAENAARMLGPALSGGLIALWHTGPLFALNAAACAVLLISIAALRTNELRPRPVHHDPEHKGTAREGLAYVAGRPDLIVILVCLGLIAAFSLNNALNIAMMATTTFHRGAGEYGFLSTILALGGLLGSFAWTRVGRPGLRLIGLSALAFACAFALDAVMPLFPLYALALFPIGFTMMIFLNWTGIAIQLATAPAMQGRVFALYVAIEVGATPIGSPVAGWVGQTFGARVSLLLAAAAALTGALICLAAVRLRPSVDAAHRSAVKRYDVAALTVVP
jgi:MFS family permease